MALFAGAGGGILGGKLLGWKTVCAVEINAFCARRLMQRQNEGHLSPFPIWDDVSTFDGRPWKEIVDVVSGGFPCTDISCAKSVGFKGIKGEKSGLWKEMARIIGEIRPEYAFVENSPTITVRGLGTVLGDLAQMGFDARWGVLGGNATSRFGLLRKRIWILAKRDGINRERLQIQKKINAKSKFWGHPTSDYLPNVETSRFVANGHAVRSIDDVAGTMDRVVAIGNGQIPAVVKLAWEILGPNS